MIACADDEGVIKLFNDTTGKLELTLKGHEDSVQDVAFDFNSKMIVSCGSDSTFRVWSWYNEMILFKIMIIYIFLIIFGWLNSNQEIVFIDKNNIRRIIYFFNKNHYRCIIEKIESWILFSK